jgi:shikimate dehydrogenase
MHNAAFRLKGINAIYLYFPSRDIKAVINAMRALNIYGLSVTIPHKQTACDYVDTMDPLAQKTGALNTLMNRDGHITGYNTDASGALAALKAKVKDIRGVKVLLIGAGGAARAAGFAVADEGGIVMVANRTKERGQSLARDLNSDFCALQDLPDNWADVIIQTTSVGMYPEAEACLVPESILKKGMLVMDIVYNPFETQLLKMAKNRGCAIITGLEMFVRQGALQFKIWTGQKPPFEHMRQTVKAYLQK